MNWKTWIPLFFAVGLALIAAKLTHDVINKKKTGGQAPGEFVQVVVARGDIGPGVELTAENLTLAPIPGKEAPAHTYTHTADLAGRVATTPLVTGQPVNEKLLAAKGTGIGLQAMVPAGFRAVTLEVNEFTGLAGMVAPGMNVDVVGTFRDEASKDTFARTVVQNLKVIAVGPRMAPAQGEEAKELYKSVTLLASPKDAEKVELAAYVGRPRLSLRNGRDQNNAVVKGASLTELVSGQGEQGPGSSLLVKLIEKMARTPRVAPTTQKSDVAVEITAPAKLVNDPFGDINPTKRHTIEVIRNGQKSTVIFDVPKKDTNSQEPAVITDAISDVSK